MNHAPNVIDLTILKFKFRKYSLLHNSSVTKSRNIYISNNKNIIINKAAVVFVTKANEEAPLLSPPSPPPNHSLKIFFVLSTAVGGERGTYIGGSVGGSAGCTVGEVESISSSISSSTSSALVSLDSFQFSKSSSYTLPNGPDEALQPVSKLFRMSSPAQGITSSSISNIFSKTNRL
eukprot:jgi/Psemu1/324946/estExt_fgenesh1_pg.C_1890017